MAPIVALMASLIIHQMPGATPEKIGLTVLGAITITTLLVGLALFFLGSYQLGNVVRFIPYPVIGGFLAGSGLAAAYRLVSRGERKTFFPV